MTFLSNFLVKNLVLAVLLWLTLWAVKKVLFQWHRKKKINQLINFYLPLIQYFVWILFTCYFSWCFSKYDSLTFFILGTAFLFLGRSFLQNLFMGIFFRLEKHDLRGNSMKIGKKEGTVLSYGITQICLKSADGNRNYVPYEKLYQETYVRTVKMEQNDELQSLRVYINDKVELSEELRERIHTKVLLNPYVVTNEKIYISQGEDENNRWILINYNLISPERSDAVKETLRIEISTLIL